MELTGDVITEDLGRMLASLCYGDLGPIKRLIEEPEDNEWVRSAALDALVDLYVEGQLERENIIDYLKELFLFKVEQKSSFIWSAMVNTACDLYPEGLVEEIRRACVEGLVNHGDVGFDDVKRTLQGGKEKRLEDTRGYRKGLIGNVVDEIGWWACFQDAKDEAFPNRSRMKGRMISGVTPFKRWCARGPRSAAMILAPAGVAGNTRNAALVRMVHYIETATHPAITTWTMTNSSFIRRIQRAISSSSGAGLMQLSVNSSISAGTN